MRFLIGWSCAAVMVHALAQAADVPVTYLVEDRPLRSSAAGDPLLCELYSDEVCTSLVHTQVVDVADATLLARLKLAKLRGVPAVPAGAELRLVMTDVVATSPLYLKVTGAHVAPLGTACQPQVAGIAGPVGPPGRPGPGHMVLRDAHGTMIGPFRTADYANNGGLVYFLTADGTPLQVMLDSPTAFERTGLETYFESADCTGTPLYPPQDPPALFLYVAGFREGRVYHAPTTGTLITPHSWAVYWLAANQCAGQGGTFGAPDVCCRPLGAPTASTLGPIGFIDVSGFVPPFHVELAD